MPHVTVPTLVLHRRGDRTVPIARGRELASLLPSARFVPLAGDAHVPWRDDQRELFRALRTFLVNEVPEPVTVKQRVHLDVHAAAVEDVLALGATPEDLTSFGWKVLRDPEGGELCVFEREVVPADRIYEIGVDARDAGRIAAWWAQVLGAEVDADPDCVGVMGIPGAPFESLVFMDVPEPKTVKNRIHWDLTVPDLGALVDAGATVLRARDDEIGWTVLADPEGNEFCAFGEA